MKILITTEQYYPISSGVSSVVTSIAEELYTNGYEVYVATGFENRNYTTHKGVEIIEFKVYGGFGNYYKGETDEYRDFILNFDCDVIVNECVQTWTTDLILKDLKKIKAKKILHSHGFSLLSFRTKNPWAYIKSKFYYFSLHKFLKEYEHIFFLHNKTIETTYCKIHKIENFSYLPNGIGEEFVNIKKNKEKVDEYLLNISNYYPMKNQEFLLEAFYKSKTNCTLVLIGSSILKNYLVKLQQLKQKFDIKYGFKKVEFLFNLSREETVDYLENATLFLHSSQLEVFPMVIVESMAKKIPFIATNVGNISSLPGGYVVDDIDSMAKKIDYLLTNLASYQKKADEGYALICKELTWPYITRKLEQYF